MKGDNKMKSFGLFNQSLEERRDMILNGKLMNTLLFLSVPTLVMCLIQSLIPIIDSLFLNRTSGYVVAASVGFVVPIINILNGMSMGLGVSGMAMIGSANGSGNKELVRKIATQLMVVGFLAGIVMAPFCFVSGLIATRFINSEIAGDVFIYLGLYSFVMPFLFLTAIFNSIKNGIGQPEATLYRMIFLLVGKVVFNTIYLYVLHLGTIGSVLGSLSSYFCISVWMYYDLFIKDSDLKLSLKDFHFDKEIIEETFRLGVPAMINHMTVNVGFVLINMEVQKYGGNIMNAQTIAINLSTICFLIPSSLSTTVTTMVSMNIGVGRSERAKNTFYRASIVAIIISFIIIVVFFPFAKPLVLLFHTSESMLGITIDAVKIYTVAIIGFSLYMIAQGAFIGLGKTKIPVFTGVLRIWLLRYLFILAFENSMGVYSVFWGNVFSNTVAGLICFVIALKVPWESSVKLVHS